MISSLKPIVFLYNLQILAPNHYDEQLIYM